MGISIGFWFERGWGLELGLFFWIVVVRVLVVALVVVYGQGWGEARA